MDISLMRLLFAVSFGANRTLWNFSVSAFCWAGGSSDET